MYGRTRTGTATGEPRCRECNWRWRRELQIELQAGRWALQRRGIGGAGPALERQRRGIGGAGTALERQRRNFVGIGTRDKNKPRRWERSICKKSAEHLLSRI